MTVTPIQRVHQKVNGWVYGGGIFHPRQQFPLTLTATQLTALHELLEEHVEWPDRVDATRTS